MIVAPGILDEPPRLGGVLVLLPVRAQDIGALAGERERDGAADAGVASGDERDPVREAVMTGVAALAVVGERLHVGLSPRRLLLLFGKRRGRLSVRRMLLL